MILPVVSQGWALLETEKVDSRKVCVKVKGFSAGKFAGEHGDI
jgi:hypothetical protein